jgi:hypothetical protein
MSETFKRVQYLVKAGTIRISEHGYDQLVADDIFVHDVIDSVVDGKIVEDYPDFPKGPCVLVLQRDRCGKPIHIVWGIPKGYTEPAVVVTGYRPDPDQWHNDYLRRRT